MPDSLFSYGSPWWTIFELYSLSRREICLNSGGSKRLKFRKTITVVVTDDSQKTAQLILTGATSLLITLWCPLFSTYLNLTVAVLQCPGLSIDGICCK